MKYDLLLCSSHNHLVLPSKFNGSRRELHCIENNTIVVKHCSIYLRLNYKHLYHSTATVKGFPKRLLPLIIIRVNHD